MPQRSARGGRPADRARPRDGRRRQRRGAPGEELEALSTQELHDRAIRHAERHLDVEFFWTLLEMVPAAEAALGDSGEAGFDMRSAAGLIKDALHSGEGELGQALRPVFLDYLRKHPDA